MTFASQMSAFGGKADMTTAELNANKIIVPGALFWFAPW